jgi:hypothetical protein
MHFGENQLSRSLIGLSPLPTDHPPGFQPWWVRASTPSYRRFTLPMGRSLRFGPAAYDSHPHTRMHEGVCALLGLAFATAPPQRVNLATHHNSQAHSSKGTPSHHTPNRSAGALTACRHMVSGTLSQPLTGALFTFPSRYSSTIGHQGIFRLTTWSWQIHTEFHELRATRDHPKRRRSGFAYRTLTVYGRPSQTSSATQTFYHSPPARQNQHRTIPQPRKRNTCRL